MTKLQCSVGGLGCLGEAIYVCHHCGQPVCRRCDKSMADPQFAPTTWGASRPQAHHCPKHYHPAQMTSLLNWTKIFKLDRFIRKFFP